MLGTEPYVDQPYYVGYRTGDLEFGLDPNAEGEGPICYWEVPDINDSVKALQLAGATVAQPPHDVGGGLQVATLTDPNGSTIGLRQPA